MISAVIFDLDGTVLDNSQIWQSVFEQVAGENNLPIFVHIPGIGVLNNWKKVINDQTLAEKYSQETKKLYIQAMQDSEVAVREGLVELIEGIKEKGWVTALATGTEWHLVERQLEQLDLFLAFDVTTTGDEVLAQKPDPEIYTLTAQKLGLEPAECVVIEDAVAGVEAGVEAGCVVIGITNEFVKDGDLKTAGAKIVVTGFDKVLGSLLS